MFRTSPIAVAVLLALPLALTGGQSASALSCVGEPVVVPQYMVQYEQGGRWNDYQVCVCDPSASSAIMELRFDFGVNARAVLMGNIQICPVYPYGTDPRVTSQWHVLDQNGVLQQALPPAMRFAPPGASRPTPRTTGPQPMPSPTGMEFPNPSPTGGPGPQRYRNVEQLGQAAQEAYENYQRSLYTIYPNRPELERCTKLYAAAREAFERATGRKFEPQE